MTLVTHRRLVATLAEAFIATLAAAGSVAVTIINDIAALGAVRAEGHPR
jgi:hypothetical protein